MFLRRHAARRWWFAGLLAAWLAMGGLLWPAASSPIVLAATASTLTSSLEGYIGASAHPDLVARYGGIYRPPASTQAWVEAVFADVARASDRQDVTYRLTLLNSDEVNAFALMGGYVYLTRGMLAFIGGDRDELANVLAHEVAHIARRHGWYAFVRRLGFWALLQLGLQQFQTAEGAQTLHRAAAVAVELLDRGWGREAEHEADAVGQSFAFAAGYDPAAMPRFFRRLKAQAGAEPPAFLQWLSTHPPLDERIARTSARAQALRQGG